MIPILRLDRAQEARQAESILQRLRLDAREMILGAADDEAAVRDVLADVARRGDDAIVETARRFDDPSFTADRIRVSPERIRQATSRVPKHQLEALRRAIRQVREYQAHTLPAPQPPLLRPGVELGTRYLPIESAGLYIPGGKAAYPSTVIMLAVPAQVAGVRRITVCTPAGARGDLVLAACAELGLTDVFHAGGPAAIAAMAFGTETIPAVDKIVGPGNRHVQLAKRALAGFVGVDGFLGPSEIVVIADETGDPPSIAADLLAQAEHDPGSCFLLTDSPELASKVAGEINRRRPKLKRVAAIDRALAEHCAILIAPSMQSVLDWANRFAAEHVSIQARNWRTVLGGLRHGGAVFVGRFSPVAAGDYVAGPSHCLPTNTTARFSSGISTHAFLRRASVERYTEQGLAQDAAAIVALAEAEGLDAHAHSVRARTGD